MAVHAGFFADPLPAGPFTYDFRTPEGTAFNNQFGIQTYPSGLVNRSEYNGSVVLNETQWEGAVEEAVRKPQQAQIEIETEYNNGNRELIITIHSTFKEALTGTYYLSAFVVEDGIVAPQQDLHEILYDYVHNHVLRTAVNGTDGDPLGNNGNIDRIFGL